MRKVNAGLVFGLGVSVAGMCLGGGCTKTQVVVATNPQAGFATLTQNEEAHIHTVHKVMRQDAKAIVEDFDILLLTDRPTRLTKWHDR